MINVISLGKNESSEQLNNGDAYAILVQQMGLGLQSTNGSATSQWGQLATVSQAEKVDEMTNL